jgi:hypothetical protein
MKARITTRSGKLESGRDTKRRYAVELFNDEMSERTTPYMITPEKAINYLRSTGSEYRNIEVI